MRKTNQKKSFNEQEHIRFYKYFEYSISSIAILKQKSSLLFYKDDFSKSFNFFCKSMKKFGYQKNDDSEMLSQYLNIFTIDKKNQ